MFDIGFSELALVCVIALIVLGPERMPQALRTLGLWFGRMRRTFVAMKTEIEREIGMDEIRQQLHNEAVMDEMKRLQRDIHGQSQPPANDSAEAPTTAATGSTPPDAAVRAPSDAASSNGQSTEHR
jgi:sec-independent protein translocase protein TatB